VAQIGKEHCSPAPAPVRSHEWQQLRTNKDLRLAAFVRARLLLPDKTPTPRFMAAITEVFLRFALGAPQLGGAELQALQKAGTGENLPAEKLTAMVRSYGTGAVCPCLRTS
jgi:hypothetical protein